MQIANLTPQEREARAEVVALTTFNYKRAKFAQRVAFLARGREDYAAARAYAEQAGIYTLDLHGARGSLPDRIAALQQRIARAIAKIYPDAK